MGDRVPIRSRLTGTVVGVGIVLVVLGVARTDTVGDIGLRGEPRARVEVSGPLWELRSRVDQDGAPDVGFLVADRRLHVTAHGAEGTRVTAVDLLVDGRRVARRTTRCAGGCRGPSSVDMTPVLAGAPGSHRVAVVARTRPASATGRVRFTVVVGAALPRGAEVEPVARRARTGRSLAAPRPEPRRSVLELVGAGVLRRLPGLARARLVAAGPTAVLLALRHPVGVTGLALQARSGRAELTSPALVDLLIETDPGRRRVRSVEPGPRTRVTTWSGPTGAPSSARASHGLRLVRLSEHGPAFGTYDGVVGFGARGRDWPVSIVFHGAATVPRVKAALRRVGLVRRGESRFVPYRLPGSSAVRFDADRGLKTVCDRAGTDLHVRVYAPSDTDAFLDPEWGRVVVATAHLDRADGCGVPPKAFGYSELAERRLAQRLARVPGLRVTRGELAVGNAEPLRRDRHDGTHVWLSDGRATLVRVPG